MPPRAPRRVSVISTEPVTPQMVRVVFGGPAFDGFAPGEFTDHYVKLKLPDPQDPETVRTRTYSVRAWDAEAQQLTIDFVVHGDVGVAGPWARTARPGDELDLVGPGGAYTPDPDADWHLLAGDASVIPAISASLPRIPLGAPVHVIIEVDGPEEEQPLDTPATSRSPTCTARPGRAKSPSCWPPPSPRSTSPRAAATCSCTARPAASATCAGT